MHSYIRTQLQRRLAVLETNIPLAEAGIIEMASGGISSFELDTGEADQQVRFYNVQTFNKYIKSMYASQELIVRRLTGRTFTSVKARRKP